jgi:hypothetical protein
MTASRRDNARGQAGDVGKANGKQRRDSIPPAVTGQCAEVLELLRNEGSVLSFRLTAELAIPEAAARVHDLRALGFHVQTTILPEVEFRGRIRRGVARYSLGVPEWPAPGWLEGGAA